MLEVGLEPTKVPKPRDLQSLVIATRRFQQIACLWVRDCAGVSFALPLAFSLSHERLFHYIKPCANWQRFDMIDNIAVLAQLVEQPPCKRQVVGAEPTHGSHEENASKNACTFGYVRRLERIRRVHTAPFCF